MKLFGPDRVFCWKMPTEVGSFAIANTVMGFHFLSSKSDRNHCCREFLGMWRKVCFGFGNEISRPKSSQKAGFINVC